MIAETLIIHAGDLIEWRESSGYVGQTPRRVAPQALTIEFTQAPTALRVFHKPAGTLLWHKNAAGPSMVVAGEATEDDLTAMPTSSYALQGKVSDPAGRYLPRNFSFTLGNSSEHNVALYHSPLGARFGQGGGIYGRVGFDTGAVAPWALIHLSVTPPLGSAIEFVAQTDQHGEFRLPLEHLPALTKDAPAPTYSAKLEIAASVSATPENPLDPDTLSPIKIAKGKNNNGKSTFANTLDLAITPGAVANVVSPKHDLIVLKST